MKNVFTGLLLLGLAALPIAYGIAGTPGGEPNMRCASASLKTLASAQADFNSNHRAGDEVEGFWRGDVSGLYQLVPKGETTAIRLIELSTAAADGRPTHDVDRHGRRTPKEGYWYRAIRHADEDPAKPDPQRFAFCAYPDDLSKHPWMFVISEGNTIFKAPAVKGGIDVFPDDRTLLEKWSKLD